MNYVPVWGYIRGFAVEVMRIKATLWRRSEAVTPVFPYDCDKRNPGRVRKLANPVLRLMIFFALIIGLPISPSVLYPDARIVARFLSIWSAVAFCVRVVFIFFECGYNHLLWPSIAMRYSYLTHCLVGFTQMLVIFIRRREIASSLLKLERLSQDLGYGLRSRKIPPIMKTLVLVCFACFAVVLALGVFFFFYQMWDFTSSQVATLSPFAEDGPFLHHYNCLVLAAVLLSYNLSSATLYVTTLLCCQAYFLSGELLLQLAKRLKKDAKRGPSTSMSVSRNVRYFKRIFNCVQRMDGALNLCAFVVYVAIINGFYIVLSMALSGEDSYYSPGVASIAGMIGVTSTIKFLSLTLFGDTISEKHYALQRDLIEVSNSALIRSSVGGIHMISLLSANIRLVELNVTGLRYFSITRKVIPSTVSVIITYGVMLYNTGATTHL